MIQLREQYWAVGVPEGAVGFDVNRYGGGSELNYWLIEKDEQTLIVKDLPPGTWQIVCTSKEATNDHAYEIVEPDGEGYKDYNKAALNFMSSIPFPDPLASLRSLLTSKGCDLNKNLLILKKQ